MNIQEILEDTSVIFKMDVTNIVQNILGKELVQSATVVLEQVEDFESLPMKKQQKVRDRVEKHANNLLEHSNMIDSLSTPGDGIIEIVFVNGKKIVLLATGGEAVELMTEDAYTIQSYGFI